VDPEVNFAPAIDLIGSAVRLRPVNRDDLQLFVRWYSDPDVLRWLHLSEMPLPTLDSESQRLEAHLRDSHRRSWIIEDLTGRAIGNVGLAGIDDVHLRAELFISIGEKDHWSGGYGTDAVRLVLRFAFEELALKRVWLIADADNPRAIRCYEKCGFQHEGVLRGHRLRYGKPLDMVMMAVLEDDPAWR
jgi:RimJ/RimL family protein N-acetyltransferase